MNPVSLRPFSTASKPYPKGTNSAVNPRLLSQLRAAVERGEEITDALDALSIRLNQLRTAYADALDPVDPRESPYTFDQTNP